MISNYPPDWEIIKTNYRNSVNWICEKCGINLFEYRRLLHTHHINGVKSDCSQSNLKALCLKCHKATHRSMGSSTDDLDLLEKIARNQKINL